MSLRRELRTFVLIVGVFLAFYLAPLRHPRLSGAILESFSLVQWYAREHMIYGLIPAFFIAGAIGAFAAKSAVMKYLGARARRVVAYAVASVSGCVLAVCSCTILPLFASIYSRGAGLGPAMTFLYAGPAINVLAIFLTARILGAQIGIARAVGAISFSIVIGLVMHFLFRKEEVERAEQSLSVPEEHHDLPVGGIVGFFAAMVAVLVFANWAGVASASPVWRWIFAWKWTLTAASGVAIALLLVHVLRVPAWKAAVAAAPAVVLAVVFRGDPLPAFAAGIVGLSAAAATTEGDSREWVSETWGFAKDILPLLLMGIMMVGFALGRPGHEGLIPRAWVEGLVGGNSLPANLVASMAGGLMYFCTMTEVPIVQGLLGAGMGKGPALAFLLAGPAVSLPNILILRGIIGTRKTLTYVTLVVIMATLTGGLFGLLAG
ncbi:MAG: permease [Candidatus Eisenbacteria bacterium]